MSDRTPIYTASLGCEAEQHRGDKKQATIWPPAHHPKGDRPYLTSVRDKGF